MIKLFNFLRTKLVFKNKINKKVFHQSIYAVHDAMKLKKTILTNFTADNHEAKPTLSK